MSLPTGFKTTLSAGITAGATSIPLSSATGLENIGKLGVFLDIWDSAITNPADDPNRERIFVYAKSGNTVTAKTRGADGTTAAAWDSGDQVAVTDCAPNLMLAHGYINPIALGADPTGTSDSYTAIQAALDVGPTRLSPGLYKVDTALVPPSNSSLSGVDEALVTIQGTDQDVNIIELDGKSNVVVEGLTLTYETDPGDYNAYVGKPISGGTSSGTATSRITIRHCTIRDTPRQAITPWADSTGWRVHDCTFINIARGGVIFDDATDAIVSNCTFDGTGDDAVGFLNDSTNCLMIGCVVRDAGVLLDQGAGVKIHGTGCTVSGCVFVNSLSGAIRIKPPDAGGDSPDRIIIQNCVVDGIADTAAVVEQSGITVEDVDGRVSILNCEIDSGGKSGSPENYDCIRVEGGADTYLTVQGCTLVSDRDASGRFGIHCFVEPKVLTVRDCNFVVLSQDIRIGSGGAGGTALIVEGNVSYVTDNPTSGLARTKAQEHVRLVASGGGYSSVRVVNCTCQNNTHTEMIDLGGNTVTTLTAAFNDRGSITNLIAGDSALTNLIQIPMPETITGEIEAGSPAEQLLQAMDANGLITETTTNPAP